MLSVARRSHRKFIETRPSSYQLKHADGQEQLSLFAHGASDFFNLPNPSSRTMDLRSTQPLREMSTRNLPGGKGRPARKADKLSTICEPIA
jgi:hypothetical protein